MAQSSTSSHITTFSGQLRATRSRKVSILGVLALLLVVICVSTAGYVIIEYPHYSVLDALYMSVITISTAGHREVHPLSDQGHIWTILVILSGVVVGAVFVSLVVAMVVEGQVRRILGRRQLESKIKAVTAHTIVCGYGRMGQMVVRDLRASRRRVVVVDVNPQRTAMLEAAGLLYVLGDAQDEETLAAAGLDRASEIIAALPTDAENVLVVLTARQCSPDVRIIVRAREVTSQKKMLQAGATRVVCPHVMGASRIVDIVLRPAVVDFFEVASKGVDLEMDQIVLEADSELAGRSLKDLDLPNRAGVHVAAIRRASGDTIYRPASTVKLEAGDTVILFGKSGAGATLRDLHL